ncbi:MAG: fatty acid desaturase, partial [Gammaproteobacteria bacterium]
MKHVKQPDNTVSASERNPTEKHVFLAKNMFFGILCYTSMVLYFFNIIPLWGMIIANVLFYIRAYLRMHDLTHGFSFKTLTARFVPTLFYGHPVWGGVTAFMTTHLEHHRFLGTDRDPWLYYYVGHPLQALFFNMIEPEVNLY